MRRIRSWCALVLAITLVGTNAVYQLGTSLSAHEQKTELEAGSVEAAGEEAAEEAAEGVTTADTQTLSAKELVEAMEEDSTEDTTQVIVTEIVE